MLRGTSYYGTTALANGQLVYHAERENDNPDKIEIYWLETKDAGIYSATAPNLSIQWPKYLRKYIQRWPAPLSAYEPVTVTNTGSGLATGPQFDAAHLPQIIFQDDPAETEVSIDVESQRLLADFRTSSDQTSRTLLKFLEEGTPWYVPLYIQSETKLGSPAVADPDGAGPLTGADAVSTINDTNADGVADLVETVKAFAAHEMDLLESVTQARARAAQPGASWATQEMMQQQVQVLVARAEEYPELRSNQNFLLLQYRSCIFFSTIHHGANFF